MFYYSLCRFVVLCDARLFISVTHICCRQCAGKILIALKLNHSLAMDAET